MPGGSITFTVPPETAFDYLVDPANRAQWQSSLARVSHIQGPVGVGQTWTDETVPGLKPAMRTTEFQRPSRWSESGTWRFVRADLTLSFTAVGTGSVVDFTFRIHVLGPLGLAASYASAPAVGADLRRASRILAGPRP